MSQGGRYNSYRTPQRQRGGYNNNGYNNRNRGYQRRNDNYSDSVRPYNNNQAPNNNYNRSSNTRGGYHTYRSNNRYPTYRPAPPPNAPDLKINSSRFSRPLSSNNDDNRNRMRNSGRSRSYDSSRSNHRNTPNPDEQKDLEFPNDWVNQSQSYAIRCLRNDRRWKATKPTARYWTSNSSVYPDRRGIPQIAKKGDIDTIIAEGCEFIATQYQIHPSLLPSTITLMLFRNWNERYKYRHNHEKEDGSQLRLHYSWDTFFKILWVNAKLSVKYLNTY